MPSDPLRDVVIVVVEDHDDARRYLGIYLRQLGAKVFEACNTFEGFEAIKNNHPDLVLSDIMMPGADGFELLRQIRALGSAAGGSVPVIAMTALVGQEERAHILDGGFRACLPKPFSPDRLLSTILTVLND
jgi:two-component system CheB/CheR fusion protein